ncbi:vWA domain-containing protein [Methylococcus capsulatus]|uniref:vWA domain-containing protein n=1 Tax=Methylococcus capsulatus TaxID=414 RepID=UPI001C52CA9B|nr:vWA domain-containing protein [Methylococcus capsulatus]QXP87511.1 VWA domain-containing protein [Methylococcus capsulatus]QXP92749.1 VWA domain-containing protein [Methylococcus capsulatus]UQN12522.1 VWA domain-containing protein [Methylococcus capsulatus]
MKLRLRVFGFITVLFMAPAFGAEPLLMPGKKTLYQRVLTRPGARIVLNPGKTEGKPAAALSRYYVYERETLDGREWLQVGGDSRGRIDGWLDAAQSVPWNQQLTLAFTNPANRSRALLFEKKEGVLEVLKSADPGAMAASILKTVESGKPDPRLISVEPQEYVDPAKKFYLLPILQAEELTSPRNVRVLEVASVTAKRGESSPAETRREVPDAPSVLRNFSAAVVFVIDSTISMGPYIDRTREAVRRVYTRIEKAGLADQVRFGLVAFRSSTQAVPGLEYVSKVYADPSEVKTGKDFLAKVASLSPAKVSSSTFDEDSYAGIMTALQKIKWSGFGGRYVVLITDAGAIDGNDPLSQTKLGADQVRIEAEQLGVALFGLHLKTPAGKADHAKATAQYKVLTQNQVAGRPLYYDVESGDVGRFGKIVDSLADTMAKLVEGASQGRMVAGSVRTAAGAKPKDESERITSDALLLGHAMQLAYLGREKGTQAPDLFQAWLCDRDYAHPELAATEVRVLLTKNELSNLSQTVKLILDQGEKSQETTGTAAFFDLLRSSAAHLVRDPAKLADPNARKLAELGLLGEYLEGLPYKSAVMNLTSDQWEQWSQRQQEDFLDGLRRKLRHYQIYHDDADRWVMLDGSNDPSEAVYPVPIGALP